MGRHATCAVQLAANDFLELGEGALEVVVDDPVVEDGFQLELALCNGEPFFDLALALGRPRAEALLELLLAGSGDEDRHCAGDPLLDREGARRLDLEKRRAASGPDPLDLRQESPSP